MEFNLQTGEKIIEDFKPIPSYRTSLWVLSFIGSLAFLLFFGLWIGLVAFVGGTLFGGIVLGIMIIFFVFILPSITANWQYDKRHYWVTNRRIVIKRGFIGYSINSIPFERISDVLISRSFWESLFKFGSVNVQSLAGQMTMRSGTMGAEGAIQGIKNPEKLQKTIFDLIEQNRKTKKLTM